MMRANHKGMVRQCYLCTANRTPPPPVILLYRRPSRALPHDRRGGTKTKSVAQGLSLPQRIICYIIPLPSGLTYQHRRCLRNGEAILPMYRNSTKKKSGNCCMYHRASRARVSPRSQRGTKTKSVTQVPPATYLLYVV